MRHAPVVLALISCGVAVCRADGPSPVPQSLLACSELKDLTERVRCYDTQVAAMKAAGSSAAPVSPTAAAPVAAAPSPAPAAPQAAAVPPRLPAPALSGAAASAPAAAPAAVAPSAAALAVPVTAATPALAAPAVPSAVASAPAQSPGAKFGSELLPSKQRPTPSKDEQVLLSSITAVKQVRPKVFLISLANGQTWLQEGSQITIFFRAGSDARIEKGLLGSYRMSTAQTGEKNWVRVTRLQ